MRFVWTQFLAFYLTVILTGSGLYTSGYYFDIEVAPGNVLGAATLDGELTGEGITGETCPMPERLSTTLTFANVGGLAFRYDVSVASTSGGACARLKAEVTRNDEQVFMGKLEDLSVRNLPLAPGDADVFHLAVFYPGTISAADPTCSFTTGFTAHQEGLFSGDAYYDSETRRHEVTIVPKPTGSGGDVIIDTDSSATVENTTDASASTGGNTVGGSAGGDGAASGSITNEAGTQEVTDSSTGDGGSGGAASAGGTAISGAAAASASSHTMVNTTETVVTGCGCTQCGCAGAAGAESESAETAANMDTQMRDLERAPGSLQTSSREEQRRERSTRRVDRSSSESALDTHAASNSAGASDDTEDTQPESAAAGEGTVETAGEDSGDDAGGGDGADSDADGDS